jgi:hypothetical protein
MYRPPKKETPAAATTDVFTNPLQQLPLGLKPVIMLPYEDYWNDSAAEKQTHNPGHANDKLVGF